VRRGGEEHYMYNTDVIELYFFSPYPPDKKFTKVDICTAIILEERVRVRWCRRTGRECLVRVAGNGSGGRKYIKFLNIKDPFHSK